MSEKTGWEHHDLENEISRASVSELLDIYKREHKKCVDKASESINSRLTPEGKEEVRKEFDLLNEGCQKVAVRIAKVLTGVSK